MRPASEAPAINPCRGLSVFASLAYLLPHVIASAYSASRLHRAVPSPESLKSAFWRAMAARDQAR